MHGCVKCFWLKFPNRIVEVELASVEEGRWLSEDYLVLSFPISLLFLMQIWFSTLCIAEQNPQLLARLYTRVVCRGYFLRGLQLVFLGQSLHPSVYHQDKWNSQVNLLLKLEVSRPESFFRLELLLLWKENTVEKVSQAVSSLLTCRGYTRMQRDFYGTVQEEASMLINV